ncbi:MAG TPA: hypothetical protein VNK04_13360 [Gemmataceae bacterium]|nr:hypothetical protein [Gemmataceae bacterium]
MKPDDIARKVRESRLGQAADRAHAAADRVYQALTRPDRPLEPETHKKPWLAALLSLLLVGAGQLYNRQLFKAVFLFLIFYGVGLVLLVAYFVAGFWEAALQTRAELAHVFQFVWVGLWLFAILDAYRTAWLLKTGKLVVRYGFLRQGLFGAAGLIPVAGVLAPSETVAPEEVNKSVGAVAADLAKERVLKWLLVRIVRLGLLGAGAVLVILGLALDVHFLLTLGGLAVLAGIVLFVV